jgi:hypothetical protein
MAKGISRRSQALLWHGRIQAEHMGVARKKSFIKGRGIISSVR